MSQVLGKKQSTLPELGEILRPRSKDIGMGKKSKSTFGETVEKLGVPILKSDGPSNGMEVDLLVIDDVVPFSFTCRYRRYSPEKDGYYYHVIPDGEYGDLDFEGKTVLINGRERRCHSFEVTEEGHLVLFVTSKNHASTKG